MALSYFFQLFTSNRQALLVSRNPVRESLIGNFEPEQNGLWSKVSQLFKRLLPGKKNDQGSLSEEEEKVYSWLYTLAQSDKDIVFEYVGSTERGLSFTEAEKRLKESGPNTPFEYTYPTWWNLLWSAFFHPFNLILIVLSALSYLANDSANGCIMMVLVFISVSLRFYQEYSSSKAAMRLSEFVRSPVKVQRCAGRVVQTELIVQVDKREIVPGDIIIFEAGDLFPGDVRLLTSNGLVVSQSSLTGEFGTTEKSADRKEDQSIPLLELKNICLMGTRVVSGSGSGLVVSTGSKTYMSTMFSHIGEQKPPDDFDRGIRRISYVLISVMLVITPVLVLVDYFRSHDLSESLLFGISVASALTPQMLPLVVNTSLAKGAIAMARDRCIVKSVKAIRDMGSMDILCIDKTGTLTMNRAIMVNYFDSYGSQEEKVLRFGFLNAYFKTEQKHPLDDAILAFVYTNGFRFQASKWTKLNEIPFNFVRRRVSVILQNESINKDNITNSFERIVVTKGAFEEIIILCSYIEDVRSGKIKDFSAEDIQRVTSMTESLSNDGLRVIGIAMKCLETKKDRRIKGYDASVESNMIFLGLISFFDPPKNTAKQALWRLAEKGVKAKVLTGDSLPLAIRICKEVGIRTTHVTTGPVLELLSQDDFHETVKTATVLARLTPTQKLRVVQSLQTAGGHVVGFLGDGVNDSLALDAANVGISVDSGAPSAKQFADIILLEKDLNVLVAGVERGRLTFANTMTYIKMSVIANIGSILSLFLATLIIRVEPLSPRQLLTQNFLYNIGQIAIPWDKMEEDYAKSPQRWSLKSLSIFILWNGPVCSVCDMSTILFIWFYYKAYSPLDIVFFRSAWFVEGLLMQTLIIHLIRTEKIPFIQDVASWPVICSTVLISAIGLAIPYTPIGDVLGLKDLPLSYLGFLVVVFIGYFFVGQCVKRAYIMVYKTWL